ncbi:MAG: AEC family transporter [Bacteroidales bacterium]|nr:AEC family transporter [Bacteroidales bacterium]
MFLVTLESIVILLGIGIIGFFILSRKIVPISILETISPLVLEVGMPCLIFTNIIKTFNPEEISNWWQLPLWWILATLVLFILTYLSMLIVSKKNKAEFGISLFYPNGLFIPVAIIISLFGADSVILSKYFIFILIYPVFFFNTYLYFFSKGNKSNRNLKKIFNPILISSLIALIITLSGYKSYVPNVILSITDLVGGISLPLIIIFIGGNLYVDFQNSKSFKIKELSLFILLKNILFPLIVLLLLTLINHPKTISFFIFLFSAMPPITAVAIVAKEYNKNVALVNQFMVSSFIFSIISLPAMMYIFNFYFKIL